MELSFKLCDIKDLDNLIKISRVTYFDTFNAVNTPENLKAYMDASFIKGKLQEELENQDSEFHFAYDGELIIGYFKVNSGKAQTDLHDPLAIELEGLYIRKAYLGKSVGQQLLDKAIEIARNKSVRYIWLGVWEKNFRAQSFYKKNGFSKFGKHAFWMGNDKQTDHLMRLYL